MGQDADQIRQQIEETRDRMGETIDALGYKADVPNRVRDNVNDRLDTVRSTVGDAVESVKSTFVGTTQTVADRIGETGAQMSQRLDSTQGRIGDARESVSRATDSLRDNVSSAASDAGAKVARVGGIVQENPLGLALGGLALGLIAGLLVPITDIERERIGPLSDQVADRAQSLGAEMIEHGKAVVQDTVAAAVASGQEHAQQISHDAQSASGSTYAMSGEGTTPRPSI